MSSKYKSLLQNVIIPDDYSGGTYNRMIDYRKALKKQGWVYLNTMASFESILDSKCNSNVRNHYHYFYNNRAFNLTMKMWNENYDEEDFENLKQSILVIENKLNDIKRDFVNGEFILRDEITFSYELDNAFECIRKLSDEGSKEMVKTVAYELYDIVDSLRRPWRRDVDLDEQIINLLYIDNCRIEEIFYLRMSLENFDMDMLYRNM